MNEIVEVQKGIFAFTTPKEIRTEKWLEEHLDCDTIVDNFGSTIIVYAFTLEPKYNYALKEYRKHKKLEKKHILRGISSDGLNSLI